MSEGRLSYYTTVRGADILRNMTLTYRVKFYQNSTLFGNCIIFYYWRNVFVSRWNGFAGRMEWHCGPDLVRGPLLGDSFGRRLFQVSITPAYGKSWST